MATTTPYGIENDLNSLKRATSDWGNLVANTINLIGLRLGQLYGNGCFTAAGFTPSDGGSGKINIAAGVAIVGDAGSEKLVVLSSIKTLANPGNGTWYVYLTQDKDADGTPTFSVTASATPAANTLQVAKVVIAGGAYSSGSVALADATARKNLVHGQALRVSSNDRQGGYLNGKLAAGTGISLTEGSDGANETLTVASAIAAKEAAATVVAALAAINFGAGFDVADGGSGQANVTLDAFEVAGTPAAVGSANIAGASSQFAAADHVHAMGASAVDGSTLEVSGGAARVKDLGVTAAKLADAVQDAIAGSPSISAAAEAGNARVVTIQLKDLAGNNLAARRLVRVWIADADFGAPTGTPPNGGVTVGTGTVVQTVAANTHYLILASTSGVIEITLTESAAKTFYVVVAVGELPNSAAVAFV